jgi:hypothetical protein
VSDTKTFGDWGEHRINILVDQHPKLDEIWVVGEKLVMWKGFWRGNQFSGVFI